MTETCPRCGGRTPPPSRPALAVLCPRCDAPYITPAPVGELVILTPVGPPRPPARPPHPVTRPATRPQGLMRRAILPVAAVAGAIGLGILTVLTLTQ